MICFNSIRQPPGTNFICKKKVDICYIMRLSQFICIPVVGFDNDRVFETPDFYRILARHTPGTFGIDSTYQYQSRIRVSVEKP